MYGRGCDGKIKEEKDERHSKRVYKKKLRKEASVSSNLNDRAGETFRKEET